MSRRDFAKFDKSRMFGSRWIVERKAAIARDRFVLGIIAGDPFVLNSGVAV